MDDKTFNLIEKMYSEFSKKFDAMDKRFDVLENDITEVKQSINKTNMTIEHDLMPKITVLFDGHIQNTQQLERIENAVNRHEDIIIRKVK